MIEMAVVQSATDRGNEFAVSKLCRIKVLETQVIDVVLKQHQLLDQHPYSDENVFYF
jgi:hypothetical protein